MADNVPDVSVVDASRKFIGYTRRGKARKLVKEGKAKWLQLEPPVLIYLAKSPDKIQHRRNQMQEQGIKITNWTEFFKDVKDIYVQNISNCQVSIEFETTPGNKTGFLFPNNNDPVNLTQFLPFEAIKASVDFRKMLNRRPPALRLLTEEEYVEYFKKKAEQFGVNVEEAIDKSTEKLQKIHNKQDYTTDSKTEPIHTVVEDDPHFGGKKRVTSNDVIAEDEIIHPRVLNICQQVHSDLDDKEKMRAASMLETLQSLERDLKLDDWEYVRSHGYWKTVKNYARTQLARIADKGSTSEGVEDSFV